MKNETSTVININNSSVVNMEGKDENWELLLSYAFLNKNSVE